MESNNFLVNIPNYNGPLEVLLDLAKNQKVNLNNISVTDLADQFLVYVQETKNINLESASEFLLMATWITYLKSKLLLPEDEEEFKASEVAEKLKLQLKKLELIRLLTDQILKRKRVGRDIFLRGMKGGIRSIYTSKYDVSLYELLKTYAEIQNQKNYQVINIPKLPVFTTEEAIKYLNENIKKNDDWLDIFKLIPKNYLSKKFTRTGVAGILAASLELSKEGKLNLMQEKAFGKIMVKKIN